MTAVLRRARAYAGELALLALLALVATVLVSGVPKVANGYTDAGLRADIARLPDTVRDLTFRSVPAGFAQRPDDDVVRDGADRLDAYRKRLPAPLPGLISEQWYTARLGPAGVSTGGDVAPFSGKCPPSLSVRTLTGADRATRMVQGRAPASAGTIEATVARPAAAAVGLRVGSTFTLTGSQGTVPVRVVGIFEQLDPAAAMWTGMPLTRTSCPNPSDGTVVQAGLLTDPAGIRLAADRTDDVVHEWRYRLDEDRLSARDVPALAAAVASARRNAPALTVLAGDLEAVLSRYTREQDAVAALLAVVQAGVLATLLGLTALAAGLVADRRRAEFALIRARGGAAATIGGRLLAETLLVVPAAVLAGRLAAAQLPGRAPAHGWLPLLAVAVVATLTAPVLATVAQRHPAFTGRRRDLARSRPSARRLVAEGFVVLLAVLGVLLVRRRGLAPGDGVDPYLVVVPVLLPVAAALVVLRLLPWPLRLAGHLAARARGAVPFLGLAGAGRGSPVHVAPLAVLVVAVATGVFTGTVTGSIADARDRATDLDVAGDVLVTGGGFGAGTGPALAAVPGVRAVAPMWSDTTSLDPARGQVRVLLVDVPAVDRVLRLSRNGLRLPSALTRPVPRGAPVPALVSPDLASQIGDDSTVDVQGTEYRFRVAAVATGVPGLGVGAQRFVVLPAGALPVPAGRPLWFNRFVVAGAGADPAALRRAGDAGQLAYLTGGLGRAPADWALPPTTVTTWDGRRADLEDNGVNRVLSFTFAAGTAGAVLLALLAVAFAVLAGAPGRGVTLSRLRTLGLSAAHGRGLLLYELLPLLTVALLAGGVAGVALPRLIGPALGLSGFTAGVATRERVDPVLAGGAFATVLLAVGAALLVESLANRRMRLGETLRLGEEYR
ncbi:ABC transporter permease [Couchioplanes caeruleus]|uniref:ABC transporter permease n=1 Tax=Couchioplanes caeruleus TaxID=56438 RepID=UPI0020C175BF|nr:ABC transporter permease [Couchioplanes caeruleus]UQU62896.1 ABC transporter permease [Couchioplanes caeruleus]